MSDASVSKATGRTWAQWVRVLDAEKSAEKPHREIAKYVSSLGTPSWWTQMVTVGYERIRGLRDRGQSRAGLHDAGKSRTFDVPVEKLSPGFRRCPPAPRLAAGEGHDSLHAILPNVCA